VTLRVRDNGVIEAHVARGALGSGTVGKLIYLSQASLDGYIADRDGNFDWAEPSEDVHMMINDLSRSVGTYLLGRRMYEVLLAWETMDTSDQPPVIADFAEIWLGTYKIVFSTTLERASSAKTMIESTFDPAAVAELKSTSDRDLSIGGPALAAHAFRAGLVDELQLFLVPEVVGGGTRFLPDDVRLRLELLDERRFDNGTTFLRYRTRS
jgi:dihydrofolate reductase